MATIRPPVRAVRADPSPVKTNQTAENSVLAEWDDDIIRASQAAALKLGLDADHPFAEDVAQEVRIAVLLAIRKTGICDERYLRRVISNGARNACRQGRVVAQEVSDDILAEIVEEPMMSDVLAERRVQKWIDEQPGQLQAVFHLLYGEGLRQREAAARLGVSQPRVSKLHHRLLQHGKDELYDLAA